MHIVDSSRAIDKYVRHVISEVSNDTRIDIRYG